MASALAEITGETRSILCISYWLDAQNVKQAESYLGNDMKVTSCSSMYSHSMLNLQMYEREICVLEVITVYFYVSWLQSGYHQH